MFQLYGESPLRRGATVEHWDDTPLFEIPTVRTVRRDFEATGIMRESGGTLDSYALRYTTAKLRHADVRQTLGRYAHLEALDLAAAVERLPTVGARATEELSLAAVGAGLLPQSSPPLVTTGVRTCPAESRPVRSVMMRPSDAESLSKGLLARDEAKRAPSKAFPPQDELVGDTGFEPVTPSLSSWCSSQLS
jgi:hypothetical protein